MDQAAEHHAPAHGYRNKGGKQEDKARRRFRGYTGTEWVAEHGVLSRRCNTEEVLTAVGAIGGAVIGNRVAEPGDRIVATLIGAIAGGASSRSRTWAQAASGSNTAR